MPTFEEETTAVSRAIFQSLLTECVWSLGVQARKRARGALAAREGSKGADGQSPSQGPATELCPGCKRQITERSYSQHLAKCLNSNSGRSAALKAEAKLGSRAPSPHRSETGDGLALEPKKGATGKKRGRPPKPKEQKKEAKPISVEQSDALSHAITAATQNLNKTKAASPVVTAVPLPSGSSSPSVIRSAPAPASAAPPCSSSASQPPHLQPQAQPQPQPDPAPPLLSRNPHPTLVPPPRPGSQPAAPPPPPPPPRPSKRARSRNSSQASSSSESEEEPLTKAQARRPRIAQPPASRRREDSDEEANGPPSLAESSSGSPA